MIRLPNALCHRIVFSLLQIAAVEGKAVPQDSIGVGRQAKRAILRFCLIYIANRVRIKENSLIFLEQLEGWRKGDLSLLEIAEKLQSESLRWLTASLLIPFRSSSAWRRSLKTPALISLVIVLRTVSTSFSLKRKFKSPAKIYEKRDMWSLQYDGTCMEHPSHQSQATEVNALSALSVCSLLALQDNYGPIHHHRLLDAPSDQKKNELQWPWLPALLFAL